jgi:hypothetical protein
MKSHIRERCNKRKDSGPLSEVEDRMADALNVAITEGNIRFGGADGPRRIALRHRVYEQYIPHIEKLLENREKL